MTLFERKLIAAARRTAKLQGKRKELFALRFSFYSLRRKLRGIPDFTDLEAITITQPFLDSRGTWTIEFRQKENLEELLDSQLDFSKRELPPDFTLPDLDPEPQPRPQPERKEAEVDFRSFLHPTKEREDTDNADPD